MRRRKVCKLQQLSKGIPKRVCTYKTPPKKRIKKPHGKSIRIKDLNYDRTVSSLIRLTQRFSEMRVALGLCNRLILEYIDIFPLENIKTLVGYNVIDESELPVKIRKQVQFDNAINYYKLHSTTKIRKLLLVPVTEKKKRKRKRIVRKRKGNHDHRESEAGFLRDNK